jgi:hypothetical protein
MTQALSLKAQRFWLQSCVCFPGWGSKVRQIQDFEIFDTYPPNKIRNPGPGASRAAHVDRRFGAEDLAPEGEGGQRPALSGSDPGPSGWGSLCRESHTSHVESRQWYPRTGVRAPKGCGGVPDLCASMAACARRSRRKSDPASKPAA